MAYNVEKRTIITWYEKCQILAILLWRFGVVASLGNCDRQEHQVLEKTFLLNLSQHE